MTYGRSTRVIALLGQPADGTVTLTVNGVTTRRTVTAGQTSFTLPVLRAGTHTVRATFTPSDRAAWRSSSAGTTLKVTKDRVTGRVSVRRTRKGVLTGTVTLAAANRTVVNGIAKVRISGKGTRTRTVTVRITRGTGTVRFRKVPRKHSLRVTWAGTPNLGAVTVTRKGK